MLSTRSDASGKSFSESMAELAPTLNQQTEQGEFYLPASHVQILEKLEHLSRYSNFIQIVVGVAGSGKSTLMKQFYPAADDSGVQACFIAAESVSGLADLLVLIVEQLKIDLPVTAGNDEKLQAIYEHADLLLDISRSFLIVVDGAEKLDDDCLDLLVNLLQSIRNPDARPHLVLFALPKIVERMTANERFKKTVDSSCHFVELKPFELDEVQGFLQHNFPEESQLLAPQLVSRLHQESFGLPGRIPKVLEKLISVGGGKELSNSTKPASWTSFPKFHLILSATVVVIAAIVWIGFPASIEEVAGDRIRVDLPTPVAPSNEPETLAKVKVTPTIEQRLKEADARLQAELTANQASQLAVVEKKATTDDHSEAEAPAQLAIAPVVSVPPAEVVAEKLTSSIVETKVENAPKKLVLKIPETKNTAKVKDTAVISPVVTTAKTPIVAKVKVPSKSKRSSAYLRDDELLSWNPKGYTLQMLGARKELSVVQFIKGQAKKDDFYYFSTIYKGKPWYVIVYGNYPSRDKAILAAAALPSALRKKKPWARSIQGVHDDIKRSK